GGRVLSLISTPPPAATGVASAHVGDGAAAPGAGARLADDPPPPVEPAEPYTAWASGQRPAAHPGAGPGHHRERRERVVARGGQPAPHHNLRGVDPDRPSSPAQRVHADRGRADRGGR